MTQPQLWLHFCYLTCDRAEEVMWPEQVQHQHRWGSLLFLWRPLATHWCNYSMVAGLGKTLDWLRKKGMSGSFISQSRQSCERNMKVKPGDQEKPMLYWSKCSVQVLMTKMGDMNHLIAAIVRGGYRKICQFSCWKCNIYISSEMIFHLIPQISGVRHTSVFLWFHFLHNFPFPISIPVKKCFALKLFLRPNLWIYSPTFFILLICFVSFDFYIVLLFCFYRLIYFINLFTVLVVLHY